MVVANRIDVDIVHLQLGLYLKADTVEPFQIVVPHLITIGPAMEAVQEVLKLPRDSHKAWF